MTTANDLITRAFRRARILGKDEQPQPDEAADALAELNDMLDLWWIDKLAVFHVQSETFALQAAKQSYTMGAGGDFNTTRPVRVVPGTRYLLNTVERPVAVLTDRASWDSIPYKAIQGPPQVLFPEYGYPLATLNFYPTPDQAYPVYIDSWARLQTLAALNTAIALPPGYNALIVNSLAIALCPDYGMEAPASVVRAAGLAKRSLAIMNYELPVLGMPSALLPRASGQPSILSGDTV